MDFVNQKSLYDLTNMFIGLLDNNFAFISAYIPKIWPFKILRIWMAAILKSPWKYISHSRIAGVFFLWLVELSGQQQML